MNRWCLIHFKTDDDPNSPGVDYTFGATRSHAVRFLNEQAAQSTLNWMTAVVTFTLKDGRIHTCSDFAIEEPGDYEYAIYTNSEIPHDLFRNTKSRANSYREECGI